jgi:hypothetical protein
MKCTHKVRISIKAHCSEYTDYVSAPCGSPDYEGYIQKCYYCRRADRFAKAMAEQEQNKNPHFYD